MYEFSTAGWVKHVVFHPVEGFEDLRWKKQGSVKAALLIVLFLFLEEVAYDRLSGFQFHMTNDKLFNVVPYFVQSVVLFFTWVIGNWAICTLFNGEGTLKKILVSSAYALVPYIVCQIINIVLSNLLIADEGVWVYFVYYVGLGWSIVLMVQAMRAVHQYTFGKTLLSMVMTVVAMLLILFLLILLLSLFQQVYVFIYQIYTEISYRIRG